MKNIVQSVKGTRDFYPKQMAIRTWLYQVSGRFRSALGTRNTKVRSSKKLTCMPRNQGDELVKQQSFVFQDRGGDVMTLRPELTPTLARMVAQKQNELAFPLRWWSFGPFWRYERPQKGRTREFFQWNIDMIGVNSPEADAELVAICAEFFRSGWPDLREGADFGQQPPVDGCQLGHALALDGDLKRIAFQLIDRKDKLPPEEWREYALEQGLISRPVGWDYLHPGGQRPVEAIRRIEPRFQPAGRDGIGDYVQFDPRSFAGWIITPASFLKPKTRTAGGRSWAAGITITWSRRWAATRSRRLALPWAM